MAFSYPNMISRKISRMVKLSQRWPQNLPTWLQNSLQIAFKMGQCGPKCPKSAVTLCFCGTGKLPEDSPSGPSDRYSYRMDSRIAQHRSKGRRKPKGPKISILEGFFKFLCLNCTNCQCFFALQTAVWEHLDASGIL